MAGKKKNPNATDSRNAAQLAVEHAMRERVDGESRSSLPIGELKELTKGRQPRSRMAFSREAGMRDKEDFIEHYKTKLTNTTKDRLSVPEEMEPYGYEGIWARASVRGHPDPTNLRAMEGKGWVYLTADQAPGLAYFDHLHGISDDDDHIYNGGLVRMIRYKELNDLERKEYKRMSDSNTQMLTSQMRSTNNTYPTFAINSRNQFADEYLNTNPVGQDFRNQLQD